MTMAVVVMGEERWAVVDLLDFRLAVIVIEESDCGCDKIKDVSADDAGADADGG